MDARPPDTADPRFRRMLLTVVVVPLGLMLAVAVLLVAQIAHLLADNNLVAHSDLVLTQAYDVQKQLIDMETGVRGYLVTGDDRFLQPFNEARAQVAAATEELYVRARGRPDQQARVRGIAGLEAGWMAYARRTVELRRSAGAAAAAAIPVNAEGKRQMDAIRAAFTDLLRVENQLRDDRADEARSAAHITFALVAVVGVVGGAALGQAAVRQVVALTRTYAAAVAAAADANAHLERRVEQRTAELARANAALGEANKELEAFAYSISHDLRAPMRHIAGFADLLRVSLGPTLSADDAENLTVIRDTAKQAGRMVDDLLGFSRVGRVALNLTAVDVPDLAEQCRRELDPDTAGRDVRWTVSPIPPVRADPALLKMVVGNLLSNAVKYTAKREAATVTLATADWPADATAAGCPPPDGAVTFAVSDNGVGFDMRYAAKLFGVFQRLHRAEDFAGTGIGLANVKRIVQRMGGAVWAHGAPDAGATFFVSLPAGPTDGVNVAVPQNVFGGTAADVKADVDANEPDATLTAAPAAKV